MGYLLALALLYPVMEDSATILTTVPIVVAGLLYGWRMGIVGAVVAFQINAVFIFAFSDTSLVDWAIAGGVLGTAAAGAMAVIAGLLGQAKRQLSETRREAEQQLRLQAGALEAAALAMVITDQNGTIQWVNSALTTMTGFSTDESVGQDHRIVSSGYESRELYEELWGTVTHGNVWEGEVVNRRKDGSQYTEAQTITPLKDEHGEISHFIEIKQDVTEKKEAEERIRESSKLASVGQLAAGVAHEINNPLGSITLFSELLLAGELSEAARQDVNRILDDARRAAGIVSNLLAYSRKNEPKKVLVKPAWVVERAIELKTYDFRKNNIEVEVETPDDLPFVTADENQLVQVMVNLLTNAEQAMRDAKGEGRITVQTVVTRGRVSVSVGDDGPGIPKENLSKIFDPFFTTKEVGQGTGLGLSISYSIVSQNDGNLRVISEKGEGTTFYIDLPAVEPINATV